MMPNTLQPITAANAQQLTQLQTVGHATPKAITWSPDSRFVLVASVTGIEWYRAPNFTRDQWVQADLSAVQDCQFSPNGQYLMGLTMPTPTTKALTVYTVQTGQPIRTVELAQAMGTLGRLGGWGFDDTSKRLSVAILDAPLVKLMVYQIDSGKLIHNSTLRFATPQYRIHSQSVDVSIVSPNLRYAALSDKHERVSVWDVVKAKFLGDFSIPFGLESSKITFTPDSRYVVLINDNHVVFYNVASQKPHFKVINPWAVGAHAFSAKAEYFITSCRGQGQLWSLRGSSPSSVSAWQDFVSAIAISPNQAYVATVRWDDEQMVVRDFPTGKLRQVFREVGVGAVAVAPRHPIVATFRGNTMCVWDFAQPRLTFTSGTHAELSPPIWTEVHRSIGALVINTNTFQPVTQLPPWHPEHWVVALGRVPGVVRRQYSLAGVNKSAVTQDGRLIAYFQQESDHLGHHLDVILRSTREDVSKTLHQHFDNSAEPCLLTFAGNDRWVVSIMGAYRQYVLHLWDIHTGEKLLDKEYARDVMATIALTPDKNWLLFGHDLWFLPECKVVGPAIPLTFPALSPDGLLTLGYFEDQLTLWDNQRGQVLRTLSQGKRGYASYVFRADGALMVIAKEGAVHLWGIPSSSPLR